MKPFVKRKVKLAEDYEILRKQASSLVGLVNAVEAQLHSYRNKDYKLQEERLNRLEEQLRHEQDLNATLTEELSRND